MIRAAGLDGSGARDVVQAQYPRGLAVDTVHGRLYWTTGNGVYRANLDGSDAHLVAVAAGRAGDVAVAPSLGLLVWAVEGTVFQQDGGIQVSDLDGADVVTIVSGRWDPEAVDVDEAAGTVYWVDSVTGLVERSRLDGSAVETLATEGMQGPFGVAVVSPDAD